MSHFQNHFFRWKDKKNYATYKDLRERAILSEIQEKSLVCQYHFATPIWNMTYFHIFLPIEKEQKEVDTRLIYTLLLAKRQEILISKSNFETREMFHFTN
jgi:5-formyltetrahydrofolate cyclo-ligase